MDLETLKQQVVTKVNALKDEARLQDILDILSDNSFDENEAYYRERLEASIRQADSGQVITDEDVHQMARQWILADRGMTQLCMLTSQQPLAKEWIKENERWESFLKD